MYYSYYDSPLGKITLTCNREQNLTGLWFVGQKYFDITSLSKLSKNDNLKIFFSTKKWLDRYFNNKKPDTTEIALSPQGTEFQKTVWKILCKIPYGEITTYGNIAKQVSNIRKTEKMSAQAIGSAIAHNPIVIIIPCHRVIGSNRSLTGYAGGIERKAALLKHEGIDMNKFTKNDIT